MILFLLYRFTSGCQRSFVDRSLVCLFGALAPHSLPVKFLRTALEVTKMSLELLLDFLLFRDCHPESSTFMWFSVIRTPETNDTILQPL